MAYRYTDLEPGSGASDFIIRQRKPTILQIGVIFLCTMLLSVVLTIGITNKAILISVLFFVMGALGWYVISHTQRNRDLVMATEFQNALFASSLGLNSKFCIIMKQDGNIVYIDRSFQEMFPDFLRQPRRSIDVLLDQGGISRMDSEKIFSAIERGVFEKVVFDVRDGNMQTHRLIMSIEPIMRPTGFVLLRGREYIEKRAGAPAAATTQPASITLFSHVVEAMNMGVYMTDPSGNVIYTNPVLEGWLGYEEGELEALNITIANLVHGSDGKPTDYEGEVAMLKKVGAPMRGFVNQKLIRNNQGDVIGCTALVHPFSESSPTIKKKTW